MYELIKLGKLKCDVKSVVSVSSVSVGEAFLDEVHKVIQNKRSAYRLRTLIGSVPYRIKGLGRRLFEDLEDNGMLRIEQSRFLGLIPYNRYIVTKTVAYEKLTNEMKDIVRTGKSRTDQDTAFLITLLHICRGLRKFFNRDEREKHRDIFRQIGKFTFFEALDDNAKAVLKGVRDAVTAAEAAAA